MAATSTTFAPPRRPQWWQSHRFRYTVTAFLFVLPALLNFAVFRYYPIIWAFRASLYNYSLLGGFRGFVGFDNYVRALTADPSFWDSMRVTLFFVLGYVPSVVGLALLLAVFANQQRRGMGVVRALMFVPVVTSWIVVTIVWGMILNKDVGLMNGLLQTIGLSRLEYLTSRQNALPTLIFIAIWKDVGYSVIILVAGLRGIASDFYDAAIVDGATAWQRFYKITLPMIRRHIMFVSVISTLFAFQVFVPVFQLTQGGPARTTNVIAFYIYRKAFTFGEMGYASALSILLLFVLLMVSFVQIRLLRADDM